MADYVIPPKTTIVECGKCKTLYVPDLTKSRLWSDKRFMAFEECPVCGHEYNKYDDVIPLWKYNLIKLFRGGFKNETD